MKFYRIVFRTKNGGYRLGRKSYTRREAVKAFETNPRGKHIISESAAGVC